MEKEYDYIIVGAGLSGLVLAKELSKKNKRVLILEKGGHIHKMGKTIHSFSLYDKRLALVGSKQGICIYRGFGVGGTSIVSCGNAVEFSSEEYQKIGIDLKKELLEARKDSFVRQEGFAPGKASARIMDAANKLGYDMFVMPKFNISGKCATCGNCVIGCIFDAKWTAKDCLKDIKDEHCRLVTGFSVSKIITKNNKAIGVEGVVKGLKKRRFFANKIILSAGGIGTPIILQRSGVESGKDLFVDLFNVTYGVLKDSNQRKELTMSVVCDKFRKDGGFIISPFIDNFVGFSSSVEARHFLHAFRMNGLMGIMTKIADDGCGTVHRSGRIDKAATESDRKKLRRGSVISTDILVKCGVKPKSIFVSSTRGAHPGGTAAIGKVVNQNLETRIKDLYVCDASVLPFAPGLPPMLTLIALSKWFANKV